MPLVAEDLAVPLRGQSVIDIVEAYRVAGEPFAYSTNLLNPEYIVVDEPLPGAPFDIVSQILAPYGLTLKTEAGVYLVIRQAATRAGRPAVPRDSTQTRTEDPLETVIVSASRYAVSRDISGSRVSIDRRSIQNLPDIGEDPIRVTQRLPGAAASGASAIAHFRGGEKNEIGIMLNGQWLFDPFHIRDYQSIFSAIDARAIEGVEIYTGGFPVRFGDRMSGLVLMDSLETEQTTHHEIGVSVFNTSMLTTGKTGNRSWLVSARRGNLDLVIDPKFGRPSYFDVFAEFTLAVSPRARFSVNALYAEDAVDVVLETEPAERDQISSDTRNAQIWIRLQNRWSDTLSSSTVLSLVDYDNLRLGLANDTEKMVAAVDDYREVQQFGFRQEWLWSPSDVHSMQWGFDIANGDAHYRYEGAAEYFGLQARYLNQPLTRTRLSAAHPKGGSYAMFVSDRWRISDNTTLEWGLRWDDQTYTGLGSDSQLSPRLSILYRPGTETELRASVGRYFQSQPIQSLQIEDDITSFWPAQRADHVILGLRRQLQNDSSIRVEVFHKDIGRVRPRFENLFDPLGLMPELQQDRVRLDPDSARAWGAEISADRRVGNINWWGSYTWSEVTDSINGKNVPRSWDQRHSVHGGFDWRSEAWSFAVATSIHSGWPTTVLDVDDLGFVAPAERNAEQHGLYASLDLRLSREFKVPRGSLLAFVEISNALNRRNECCLDWDFEENAAGGELLERGQDYWMPLLPAIGVLWEF